MSNETNPTTDPSQPVVYQIRIKGRLGRQWRGWFGDTASIVEDVGDTLINVSVVDQAALHGLLKKVRDLGVILISVNRVDPNQYDAPGASRERGQLLGPDTKNKENE